MNKVEILKIAFGDCKRQKDELLFFCPFCKHDQREAVSQRENII